MPIGSGMSNNEVRRTKINKLRAEAEKLEAFRARLGPRIKDEQNAQQDYKTTQLDAFGIDLGKLTLISPRNFEEIMHDESKHEKKLVRISNRISDEILKRRAEIAELENANIGPTMRPKMGYGTSGKAAHRPAIYMTIYGNTADWNGRTAFDMDSGENIPIEMVDFNKFVRESE